MPNLTGHRRHGTNWGATGNRQPVVMKPVDKKRKVTTRPPSKRPINENAQAFLAACDETWRLSTDIAGEALLSRAQGTAAARELVMRGLIESKVKPGQENRKYGAMKVYRRA